MTTQEELDLFYQKPSNLLKGNEGEQISEISSDNIEKSKLVNIENQTQRLDEIKPQSNNPEASETQYIGNISRNYRLSIEKLIIVKGIGSTLAKRLCDGGFWSVDDIVNASIESLSTIPGISISKAEIIQNNVKEAMKSHGRVINLSNFSESKGEVPLKEDITIHTANKASTLPDEISDFTDEDRIGDEFEEEPESVGLVKDFKVVNVKNDEVDLLIRQEKVLPTEEKIDLNENPSIDDNESLTDSEYKELIYRSKETLNKLGYKVIEKIKGLNNNLNFLYFKSVRINTNLILVLVVPIKIADFKGVIKVSENSFEYEHHNQDIKKNESLINTTLYSYIDQLINISKEILYSLGHENQALNFFKKTLTHTISVKKSLLKNKLFFHSGSVQYKFLIEPILINSNRVVFLEKIIPFAYQRHSNIHVIEHSKLKELLTYLEKKYYLVEQHRAKTNDIKNYSSMVRKTASYISSMSIPVFIGECILVCIFFFGFMSFSNFLVLGSCLLGVNLILAVFLSFKDLKKNRELNKKFSIPYYKTLYTLDESSITLINEDIEPELMLQFAYECCGENLNYPVLSHLVKEKTHDLLNEKRIEKVVSEKVQLEQKDNSNTLEGDLDLFEEFKDFVEDDPK